ncbi:MAG: hydroxymethylglutaryl-CoA synthase, partial [Myxococcota bacterium]
LHYNRLTGNTYTASLFESLASLLDTCKQDLSSRRIGFFAYGSGCMGEFFSGVVQPGYNKHLLTQRHENLLHNRTPLSFAQYESWWLAAHSLYTSENSQNHLFEHSTASPFRLAKLQRHKRIYEYNEPAEKPLAAAGCPTSIKQPEINP